MGKIEMLHHLLFDFYITKECHYARCHQDVADILEDGTCYRKLTGEEEVYRGMVTSKVIAAEDRIKKEKGSRYKRSKGELYEAVRADLSRGEILA